MKNKGDASFALGIGIGTAAGFVLGSLLGSRMAPSPDLVRRIVDRIFRHELGPKFEYLLQ
jgi:hypothetical protein